MQPDIGHDEFEEFMENVDGHATGRLLEVVFGQKSRQSVVIESLTVAESLYLLESVVHMMNDAKEDGDFVRFAVSWRIMHKLTDEHDEIEDHFEDMMSMPQMPAQMIQMMEDIHGNP